MRHARARCPVQEAAVRQDIRTRNVALGPFLKGLLITFNLFQWVVSPRLPRRAPLRRPRWPPG
jgi:hypothetical protein